MLSTVPCQCEHRSTADVCRKVREGHHLRGCVMLDLCTHRLSEHPGSSAQTRGRQTPNMLMRPLLDDRTWCSGTSSLPCAARSPMVCHVKTALVTGRDQPSSFTLATGGTWTCAQPASPALTHSCQPPKHALAAALPACAQSAVQQQAVADSSVQLQCPAAWPRPCQLRAGAHACLAPAAEAHTWRSWITHI